MRFSIITINYNNAIGLRRTIESVVTQTCKDFEYIIIDGGSTDGSVDIIKEYAEKIDYWVSEPDKGIYNAMNKGVKVAKGDYCNFMNSGDRFYDNVVLEKISKEIDKNAADYITGNAMEVDSEGEVTFIWNAPIDISCRTFIDDSLLSLQHQACFIKRKWLNDFPYDESLSIVSDWKHFLECIVFRRAQYLAIPYTITFYAGGGISACTENRLIERSKVIDELLPPMIYKDYLYYSSKDVAILDRIRHPMLTSFCAQLYNCCIYVGFHCKKLLKKILPKK